jgi:hypothetical protein
MLPLLAAFGIQVKARFVQTPLTAADRSGLRVDIRDIETYCCSFGKLGCSDVITPAIK